MYKELSGSLLKSYKQSHSFLFKSLSIFLIVLVPIGLMFAPLPAFLLYTRPVFSLEFLLSSLLFVGLVIFVAQIYDKVHDRKYLLWAISVMSYKQVAKEYLMGQLKFAGLIFVLLISGIYKLEQKWQALPVLCSSMLMMTIYYQFRFKRMFNSKAKAGKNNFILLFINDVLSRAMFSLIFYWVFLIFLVFLVASSPFNAVSMMVSLGLVVICLLFCISIDKIVFPEVRKYQFFFTLISPRLYNAINNFFKAFTYLLKTMPILIGLVWSVLMCA